MHLNKTILSNRYIFDEEGIDKKNSCYHLIKEIIKLTKISNNRNLRKCCPLCNGENASIISERDRYGLPITFLICLKCEFIFSKEYFSENFMLSYYKSTYNKFRGNKTNKQLFLERTNSKAPSFERYKFIKKILRDQFHQIKVVMEPGCNDGCNLYPFYKNSKEVYGCDFDDESLSAGRGAGIDILTGGIEKLLSTEKKADLIILSHVLGHVTDLNKFLKDVKRLLKPNGFIYIETPGFKGWWNKIKILRKYRKNFLDFIQFEFCYIFDLNSLQSLLANYNLELYYGDEYIKSIFKFSDNAKNNKDYIYKKKKSNIDYLLNMEKRYLKFLFLKNKILNFF